MLPCKIPTPYEIEKGSPPSPDDLKKLGQLSQFMGVADQQNFDTHHLTYREELSRNISDVIQNILAVTYESPLEGQRRVARFIYNLLAAAWHTNQPETALLITELLHQLNLSEILTLFLDKTGNDLIKFFEENLQFPPTNDSRNQIERNIPARVNLKRFYKTQLTDPNRESEFDILLSLRAHYIMLRQVFVNSQGNAPRRLFELYKSIPSALGLGFLLAGDQQPKGVHAGLENVARIISYIHPPARQPLWVRLLDHIYPDLTFPPTAYTQLKGKGLVFFMRQRPEEKLQQIRRFCMDWLKIYFADRPININAANPTGHDLLAVTIGSIVGAMWPSLTDIGTAAQCWELEREVNTQIWAIQQHTSSLSSGGECFQSSDTHNRHLLMLNIYSLTFWDSNTINIDYPPGWVVQLTFKGQSAPSVFCILGRDGNLYFERRRTFKHALYTGQKEFQGHQPIESYLVNKLKLLLLSHLQHILFPPEAEPGDSKPHQGGHSITKPHLLSLGPDRNRRTYTEKELREHAHQLIFGHTPVANPNLSQRHIQALEHPLDLMRDYLHSQIQFHTTHNIPLDPEEFEFGSSPPYDDILLRMAILLPTVLLSALQDYQKRVGGHKVTVRSGHSLLELQRKRGQQVKHRMQN